MQAVAANPMSPESAAMRAELAAIPDCPPAWGALWYDFLRLSARRPSGLAGPGLIPASELESYSRITGASFTLDEYEVLMDLDAAYIHHDADLRLAAHAAAAKH